MTSILQQARSGKPLDIDVIDMHGHIGRSRFAIPDVSVQGLIDSMDRLGIDSMMCCPMGVTSPYVDEGSTRVLVGMREFPDRILGYVGLFPSDPQAVREAVERWLAEGFLGLKMHDVNGFPYTDSAYAPAWEIANERCLPVLLHTWGEKEEFKQVRKLSKKYPQAAILTAHVGSENEPDYIEMAKDCPNVFLQLSYSAAPRGLVARLVETVGAERAVWGSDCQYYSQAEQLGTVTGADISEEDKKSILHGNARKILDRILTE